MDTEVFTMVAQPFGRSLSPISAGTVDTRRVGFLLGLGILLAPWLFAWILLRPGYSNLARVLGLGWCAVVIVGVLQQQNAHTPVRGQTIANGYGSSLSSAPAVEAETAPSWHYETRKDEMRGETSSFASILSSNSLDFAFPYKGGSTAKLTLRQTGDDLAIMLVIDRGQFTCFSAEADRVVMKFDSGPVLHYSCDRAADGSSNVVFLGPVHMILRQLKGAQQLTVEAQFFHEGQRQIKFHTAGLKW